jgi:general secretion pathway protein G
MDFFSRRRLAPSLTPTPSRGSRGFTMMELMVVIAIILVLIAMAAGRYERSVARAKEAVLKQDLQTMRGAIEQFTLDKQQAPQSLDDLVSAGYLREVPMDPITRARDWHSDFEDMMLSPEQTANGITDVHSSSESVSSFEGTPYSSW